MAGNQSYRRRPSVTGRSTATGRGAATTRRSGNRGDYRYQNIVQSPYEPRVRTSTRGRTRIQSDFDSPWVRLRQPITVAAVVVVLALAVFLVSNTVGSCAENPAVTEGATRPAHITVTREQDVAYSLSTSDVLGLPDTPTVTAVALSGNDLSFSVDSDALSAVNGAIAAVQKLGPCGFTFTDLATGRTLALNAGQDLYVASASKAPLIFYAMTHPENGESVSEDDRENIEWAIVDSDNDAYFALCRTYFYDEYMEWLAQYGIDTPYGRDDYFPTMSARSLAAVWSDIYQWIQSGDEDAQWLAGLFGATEESYIRDALAGTGATVADKAGWMGDDDARSVTDAGIVQAGGRTYLVAVITEQPEWDDQARPNTERLVRALFNIRGLLAPHVKVGV